MKRPLILTIDVGTQSLRVALFDKTGSIVAIVKKPYKEPYVVVGKGGAEQDPDFYYNTICEGIKELKTKHESDFNDVIGICMDTIRDTSVILNENFKPLHRTILWLDQRLAKCGLEKRPLLHRCLVSLAGIKKTLELNMHKSISLWYQENEPEIWKKAKYYCNISGYLTYLLTSEYKDSPASEIGHFPLNFKKCVYYTNLNGLKNIYGIPAKMMPELVPQGGILGYINKKTSDLTGLKEGLPLYSCGSDKSCESLGVGALDPDVAAISYGTASTIEVTTKKYYDSEPFLPAYPSCIPGYYNMDVQIYRGYWMINWFLKHFCHYDTNNKEEFNNILESFNEMMDQVSPGCDGLILQPYWQPGLAKPLARGAVVGFTDTHTSVHFYRAIIEGICFALREAMEHFEKKTKCKVKTIMISGGGSQSDAICRVTADIFGRPVSRVQTYETSSLGAAIAGFVAAKEFKDVHEALEAMVHKQTIFKPNDDVHKIYNKIFYKGYRRMYSSLIKIYKNIND